jgi:hypothetical protein
MDPQNHTFTIKFLTLTSIVKLLIDCHLDVTSVYRNGKKRWHHHYLVSLIPASTMARTANFSDKARAIIEARAGHRCTSCLNTPDDTVKDPGRGEKCHLFDAADCGGDMVSTMQPNVEA